MTSIFSPTSTTTRRPVWKAAAPAGLAAAALTTALAAVVHAAGVSLAVDGAPIPLAGFATMTLAAVVIGYVLAIALDRWATRPRRSFLLSTVILTAASFVPDLTVPMSAGTRVLLIATHVVAASIVIPALAARLASER